MRYESVVLSRLVRMIVRRGIEISTESECSRLRNDFDQIVIFYDLLQDLPYRSAARFVDLYKDEIARWRCDLTASRSVWDDDLRVRVDIRFCAERATMRRATVAFGVSKHCDDRQRYQHSDDQDDNGWF